MRRTIESAIAELTPGLREAFVMKHLEGCSYERMAERMDVSDFCLEDAGAQGQGRAAGEALQPRSRGME